METILNSTKEVKNFINKSLIAFRSRIPYHYVYTHSTNGVVFYVGKGSHNRAIKVKGRGISWYEFAFNKSIEVNIVSELLSNTEALQLEQDLINKYSNTCINKQIAKPKEIVCLTRTGDLVKEYTCCNAVQYDGFKPDCVKRCCDSDRGLHSNKVWMYKDEYLKNGFAYKQAQNHARIIIQKTLQDEIIRELLTAEAFVEFGFKPKNIQQVCVGKKKSHMGFIFCYK